MYFLRRDEHGVSVATGNMALVNVLLFLFAVPLVWFGACTDGDCCGSDASGFL